MDFNMTMAEVRRAMSLDRSFYQEVANDDSYGPKALQIVIIAAALTGLGSFLGALLRGNFFGAIIALILGVVMAVVGYYIWAYVVQFVGSLVLPGPGDGAAAVAHAGLRLRARRRSASWSSFPASAA